MLRDASTAATRPLPKAQQQAWLGVHWEPVLPAGSRVVCLAQSHHWGTLERMEHWVPCPGRDWTAGRGDTGAGDRQASEPVSAVWGDLWVQR